MYSLSTVRPYLFYTMILFSVSGRQVPKSPGLKWIAITLPSVLLARSIFPLKPQLRSVMPMVKASMIIARGLLKLGFQTVIVDSAEARAMIL